MRQAYKLIPAIVCAVIVYVVFLTISVQLAKLGTDSPFVFLAPVINTCGIGASIMIFFLILVK